MEYLNIDHLLGSLFAHGVINFDDKKMIESQPTRPNRVEFFLNNVLMVNLNMDLMDKHTKFVEILKQEGENGDRVSEKLAKDLSSGILKFDCTLSI